MVTEASDNNLNVELYIIVSPNTDASPQYTWVPGHVSSH